MNPRDLPEICTVPEVAAALRVTRQTVYGWIRAGNLPASRMTCSTRWLVRKADVLSRLEETGSTLIGMNPEVAARLRNLGCAV